MLKMMKYEYRRSLGSLSMLLVIFGILQALLCVFVFKKDEGYVAIAATLLMFLFWICYIYVLFNGVSRYSKELKNKEGYLVFMTPISTYKIMGAKLLASFLTGCTFVAVFGVFGVIDAQLIADKFNLGSFIDVIKSFIEAMGVSVDAILVTLLAFIITFLIEFYMIVTIAYLSVSLSATALQNKKGKTIISFILFVLLAGVVNAVALELPKVEVQPDNVGIDALISIWPITLWYLAVSVISYLGTSVLLDKKISL